MKQTSKLKYTIKMANILYLESKIKYNFRIIVRVYLNSYEFDKKMSLCIN